MARIDLPASMERIDFPQEVWAWLDLLGDVVVVTQQEALAHDETFLADTAYKQVLVRSVNRDVSTLSAIYVLLRCEFIHQAAAHVRLLCEALITISYISRDPTGRVPLFSDYAAIDEFRVVSALLEWERQTAKPELVTWLDNHLSELRPNYDRLHRKYSSRRPRNWCNATVRSQAEESDLQKLYETVYGQMSAYVHGSAWSLRRQIAYSRKHHDPRVVQADVAIIVRTTIVVWLEWAQFADRELGWSLLEKGGAIGSRCDALDAEQFPANWPLGA